MKRLKFLGFLLAIPLLCGCYNSIGGGTYPDAEKYLVGNQTYTSNINSIDIDWAFGKVTLISDETITGAIVKEENNLPEEEKVHSYLNEGELLIKFFASGYRGTNINPKDKELYLTYNPNDISVFDIGITSATLITPKLVAKEKVIISMTSGEAVVEGIDSPKSTMFFSSGSIKVNHLKSKDTAIHATSGSVNVASLDVDELDVDMSSGEATLTFNRFNNAKIAMTSGDANITLPSDGGIANIHKTSGTVIASREHTASGDKYIFGTSESTMNINITSGKVAIS